MRAKNKKYGITSIRKYKVHNTKGVPFLCISCYFYICIPFAIGGKGVGYI